MCIASVLGFFALGTVTPWPILTHFSGPDPSFPGLLLITDGHRLLSDRRCGSKANKCRSSWDQEPVIFQQSSLDERETGPKHPRVGWEVCCLASLPNSGWGCLGRGRFQHPPPLLCPPQGQSTQVVDTTRAFLAIFHGMHVTVSQEGNFQGKGQNVQSRDEKGSSWQAGFYTFPQTKLWNSKKVLARVANL